MSNYEFIPVSKDELEDRNLWYYDFLIVSGDAYVDNPAFDAALYARMLEADGFRVAILAQPNYRSAEPFAAMGRPRLGVIVSSGRLDSMLANYTASNKRRVSDPNSPGGRAGMRPDHAVVVYSSRVREAFPGVPLIICGPEASLRRFAHYDYWDNRVRNSILVDSGADMLVYGTGEAALREIARRMKKKLPLSSMTDIRGTAYICEDASDCAFDTLDIPSDEDVRSGRRYYADAIRAQLEEYDHVMGRALVQQHGSRYVVVNPPALPLTTAELDALCELPFTRDAHPMYKDSPVPSAESRRFSVIAARGCEDERTCSPASFHQSRVRTFRSAESIIKEVRTLTKQPGFSGCIELGDRHEELLYPGCSAVSDLIMPFSADLEPADHAALLRRIKSVPGVKKVTVCGELPAGYINESDSDTLFLELLSGGRTNLYPAHCSPAVLDIMGLAPYDVYAQAVDKIAKFAGDKIRHGTIPGAVASHPGCSLNDTIAFACCLNENGMQVAQVFDFYPVPGAAATCMYFAEIDPRSMKHVEVAKDSEDREKQHLILQWKRPDMRKNIMSVLRSAGRGELIGFGDNCLIKPDFERKKTGSGDNAQNAAGDGRTTPVKPVSKKGWAKAKPKKNARPSGTKRK